MLALTHIVEQHQLCSVISARRRYKQLLSHCKSAPCLHLKLTGMAMVTIQAW